MLSAEDISATKVAIELCNNLQLKREILRVPGSEYALRSVSKDQLSPLEVQNAQKKLWNEIIEEKAKVMLERIGLSKQLQEKVTATILLVGMRMAIWADHHERTFDLSRQYCVNFLNSLLFTSQGIVDNKKAAIELVKDKNLCLKQRYKLSCLYCFTKYVPSLHRQLRQEKEWKEFYNAELPGIIRQPELVKFWSYYLMGSIDKVKQGDLDEYRLRKVIESGNIAAVEYYFKEICLGTRDDSIIFAAEETVRHIRMLISPAGNDFPIFQDHIHSGWVQSIRPPSDHYVDVLCYLLSKMKEDQLITFLKNDVQGVNYKRYLYDDQFEYSRVLESLLNWPYQNYFMRIAKLMWEFLPERSFGELLLCISIKSDYYINFRYGQEKYNYKRLLQDFWGESPEHFKRYVLNDQEIISEDGSYRAVIKQGETLLWGIFCRKNFTFEDKRNIEMILGAATDKEKENIIHSMMGKETWIYQVKHAWMKSFAVFVHNCFLFREDVYIKKGFIFTEAAIKVYIDSVRKEDYNTAIIYKMKSLGEFR